MTQPESPAPKPKKPAATPPSPPDTHPSYVPASESPPEFTWPALLAGALLGIVFGASSLYLVLKVGLTVSASIPVAVLSITLSRALSKAFGIRRWTILENNIVQTTGSAGESIAFGVGVTMPALMLMGFEMDIGRVMVVSILGGLLGILMMIPLRRAFIVKQHGTLKYPEGTACADVLIVGEQGGASAKTVFVGFAIAFVYYFLNTGMKLFQDIPAKTLKWFKGATPAMEVNPALLGVGYIIGTRISCIMVAGGVLSAFVLAPMIHLFGDGLDQPLDPGTKLIRTISDEDLNHAYVLYIGAGAVAAGGIISLFQSLPLIGSSIRAGLRDMRLFRKPDAQASAQGVARTDRDLPLWLVGIGSIFLVGAIWGTSELHKYVWWVPQLEVGPLGSVMIVLFGFLFVTVSSRLTGEIGSSSNPISGMTVATLLLTCVLFLALGKVSAVDKLAALSVAAVVCIAASNGGTTSQDLKTGFLVGGTPKWQQLAILVGSFSSALVIGWILIVLNQASTVYTTQHLPTQKTPIDVSHLDEMKQAPEDDTSYHVLRVAQGEEKDSGLPQGEYLVDNEGKIHYLVDPGINGNIKHRDDGTEVVKYSAPKAQLMAFITNGVLSQKLPWTLVLIGVSIALVLELSGVPSLPFAVGVYLPLSASTPIFVGGLIRYVADKLGPNRDKPQSDTDSDMSSGVLLSTGYIAGGTIAGVVIAFLSFSPSIPKALTHWQFRHEEVTQPVSFQEAARQIARRELNLPDDATEVAQAATPETKKLAAEREQQIDELADDVIDINKDQLPRLSLVPKGTTLRLPHKETYTAEKDETLGDVAAQKLGSADRAALLWTLNQDELAQSVVVPAGTALTLPDKNDAPGDKLKVDTSATLAQIASGQLHDEKKAITLWNLNEDTLQRDTVLPKDTELKIPQHTWPAMAAFGGLVLLLLIVGLGWLFSSPTEVPVAKP